jgi:hypothetical protein
MKRIVSEENIINGRSVEEILWLAAAILSMKNGG